MKRLMLAAMHSGAGKTALTCGLLAALKARGLAVRAFKCGPDYIDPMFHTRVLGVESRNLDLFLQGEAGVRAALAGAEAAAPGGVALLEGEMGFYDGVAGGDEASAWAVARATGTPVVLVLRPGGASLTLAAQVKGMLAFRPGSRIAGLLLNDCKPMLAAHLKPILEQETGLPVLGYLPPMAQAELQSRHLGLLTAAEVEDFAARFAAIAAQLEQTADLDALLALAGEEGLPAAERPPAALPPRCRIAVAKDEAFCFYYADNLDALRAAGAELAFFSPLRDAALPPEAGGLYLGGGYPELHARALAQNASMRRAVAAAVAAGLPTVAECGGFLYLQAALQGADGGLWPMAGALPGEGVQTGRLQRFGYLELTAQTDSLLLKAGETAPAHEFHYWDCTQNGAAFAAQKPAGPYGRPPRRWRCGVAGPGLYAAFPHLHFGGALPLAQRFADAAARWQKENGGQSGRQGAQAQPAPKGGSQ